MEKEELEPQGIGAATEPPKEESKGIKIAKDSWNADELAFILGLRKSFDEKTGQFTYGVTGQNILTSLIGGMIVDHEKFKRSRMGLRTVGGAILNPFAPGGNGNGPG
jgi:hypothetical protein